MNKKLIQRISIVAFILVILAIIIIPKLKSKQEIAGAPAAGLRGGGAIPVTIKVVHPETFENKLEVSGSVISSEEVELHTEISGKIINRDI